MSNLNSRRTVIKLIGLGALNAAYGIPGAWAAAAEGAKMVTDPAHIRFATAGTGSGWYAMGGAFRNVLLKGLPNGSSVEVMSTPMAIANTFLVSRGDADVGLNFPPVVAWAEQGVGPFKEPISNIRGLLGGLDQYWQRVTVRNGYELEKLSDIKEKKLPVRIGTGPDGSLNEYMARLILEANGITYDDIKGYGGNVVRSGLSVITDLFQDNRLDMVMGITTPGHPNTAQLSIAPGQRFLGLQDHAIEYLKKYGFSEATMPAGMFEKQDYPVKGVGWSTGIYASSAMSDDEAYSICKSILAGIDELKGSLASMKDWTPQIASDPQRIGGTIHPGAEAYFKEAGLR